MQNQTLNINQASCLVERATLEGREFINVCTGQVTKLDYTAGEYIFGAIFLAFAAFILFNFFSISSRIRR